jgi:tRNA pseudouridine55 synthase
MSVMSGSKLEPLLMHGFLNIDKPAGMTSHDVVARVRRISGERRVGHAGTLDPAATGVLVVALGQATRLIEYVQEETRKGYRAIVRLGVATTTDDAEGDIIGESPLPPLDEAEIEAALAAFRGTIMQVPPMFSALHHEGKRLHELARAGVTVERAARPVEIERLDLLAWEPPLLTLDVLCGKGTYIRSLARDLGAALRCGGHLASLRRTAVGAFVIEDAVALAVLELGFHTYLLPPERAVADWPTVTLNDEDTRRARNGMALRLIGVAGNRARAAGPDGTLLALLTRDGDVWRPEKVFEWR